MTSPWWSRQCPARPTSWWHGAAKPRRCMTRANMTPWSPPANRSLRACWPSRCRPSASRRAPGRAGRSRSGPATPTPRRGSWRSTAARSINRFKERKEVAVDRRLPGHQPADQPNHHARPRRLRHLGGGDRRRDPCRPLRHLHRRRRRLHHRPARRAEGAPARQDRVRGHAGTGVPGRQGAAGALGGTRHGAQHADLRPFQLRQARGYRPARQPAAGHADLQRGGNHGKPRRHRHRLLQGRSADFRPPDRGQAGRRRGDLRSAWRMPISTST